MTKGGMNYVVLQKKSKLLSGYNNMYFINVLYKFANIW